MGVLNVTPDSFSDGGQFSSLEAAVDHALKMIAEGADFVDVGGESTRPGAAPVEENEEIRRVIPVIRGITAQARVPISVDTLKPTVAAAALDAGASVVNDVGAGRDDDGLWRCVASRGAGYVAMHMRGTPATMQSAPQYADVVGEIDAFFGERLDRIGACGLSREQVILDPGLGFGKTQEHSLKLLANLKRFRHWDRPLLLGLSRKSFVGAVTGVSAPSERVWGSVAGAVWGCLNGAQIIRAHDVAATRQALRMAEAIVEHRSDQT
ncbi:MAG: dihydropteroate synthase [Verrucomicrobia bacterium]|nr:dihydropteroate synthase [Verrucomicrobiota bacterium]MBI3869493.1 dihydropteroate synthase [Verrucomicrobiota bacterium]